MRVSLYGVIRLSGLLAAIACAAAIAMARLEPQPWRLRLSMPPAFGVINGFVIDHNPGRSRLLDVEQGQVSRLNLPTRDRLDYGSFSPWWDEEGEIQLVGRWEHREGTGPGGRVLGLGLARYALPSGRMLDEIPLDLPPASHPCWFPDQTARVIFSGGDGALYRLDFEGPGVRGETPVPEPITWRVPPPGSLVLMRDPVWPLTPRLGGRLFVTLVFQNGNQVDPTATARVWWLQLDPAGRSIVDAAPLAIEEGSEESEAPGDARFPNVATLPDGRLSLAWLTQRDDAWRWDLHLATLHLDPATGVPSTDPGSARILSRDALPSLTPFSPDGQFLYAVVTGKPVAPGGKVVRFPTTPQLAAVGH